jgi:fructosamine-3-kinase
MHMLSRYLETALLRLEPGCFFEKLSTNHVRSSSGRSYFCKVSSRDGEQFRGEALSLRLMNVAAPGMAPEVFFIDQVEGHQTLMISEHLDLVSLRSTRADELAIRLASLHQNGSTDRFGFEIPSYCGATRISHGWFETWEACYSSMIGELLAQLRIKDACYVDLCKMGEEVRERCALTS